MKPILMVAAGIAVGLTAAIAVLIQILLQLLPLAVAVLVVVLVVATLRRARRRAAVRSDADDQRLLAPVPAVPTRPLATAGLPTTSDHVASYLFWGPAPGTHAVEGPVRSSHVRRTRAGARPSRTSGGRRP